jgi:primosomal protein DnaI
MDAKLPTFFTSNLNLEELEQHLSISKQGVDIVKAKRIIARIEQLTTSLEMQSKNLRK